MLNCLTNGYYKMEFYFLSHYNVIVENVISAKIESVDRRRPMAQNPFLRIFR